MLPAAAFLLRRPTASQRVSQATARLHVHEDSRAGCRGVVLLSRVSADCARRCTAAQLALAKAIRQARGPLSRRGDHAACYRRYLHRAGPTSARTTKSEPPAHQRCSLRLRPRPACLGPLGGLFRSPRGQLIISSEGPHLDGFVSIQVTMVLAISKISQRRGSR